MKTVFLFFSLSFFFEMKVFTLHGRGKVKNILQMLAFLLERKKKEFLYYFMNERLQKEKKKDKLGVKKNPLNPVIHQMHATYKVV